MNDDHYIIVGASEHGDIDIVRQILANSDPLDVENQNSYNQAIVDASERGYVEIVRLLLDDGRAEPAFNKNEAIDMASQNGHVEVVRLLLADDRVNPADDDNAAIQSACEQGQIDVIRLLLTDSRVNPTAKDNWCIRWASSNGHLEVVNLLSKDPRVMNTFNFNRLTPASKDYLKRVDKNYIRDTTIAMSGLNLPPYVLSQILSENVVAYDLYNIAESITPILHRKIQLLKDEIDETGKRITIASKRKPVMLKSKFIQV